MSTPRFSRALIEEMLGLAPTDLPNFRSARYSGGGLEVPLGDLAPDDRALVRRVYDAVLGIALSRPDGPTWSPDPGFVARVRAVGEEPFVRSAQRLGEATVRAGAGPLARKVIHDVRGGGLTALVGTSGLLALGLPDPELLVTCGRLARDHCKIMRGALTDLDPPRRAYDERLNRHGVEEFVRTWDNVTVCEYGREVAVAVTCAFDGGVAASCLENGAIDRVLYNHVNNAARFTADGRVALAIFGIDNGRLTRWVVSNAVAAGQREWLAAAAGGDLGRLYAGGVTSGGSGYGLASCGDFVAAAFGLPSARAAVAAGYLGARLAGDQYQAWFHWPAYLP
jgi:hypothetical protein